MNFTPTKNLIGKNITHNLKYNYMTINGKVKQEWLRTITEKKGIYSLEEKQQLYNNIVEPKLDSLGKIRTNETVVYYQGKGKTGQCVNTIPSEVWHYNIDKNLVIKKVKKSSLYSTESKSKDEIGYRKYKKIKPTNKQQLEMINEILAENNKMLKELNEALVDMIEVNKIIIERQSGLVNILLNK